MSTSELSQLACEFDCLNDEADRTRKLMVEAKAAAELAECRANGAKGRLKDALAKASIDLPCTIEIKGTIRLLTVYEDLYGLCYVITTNPNPQ